jgi:hypothetical protein
MAKRAEESKPEPETESVPGSESSEELTLEAAETAPGGWLWVGIEFMVAIIVWLIWYGSASREFWRSE